MENLDAAEAAKLELEILRQLSFYKDELIRRLNNEVSHLRTQLESAGLNLSPALSSMPCSTRRPTDQTRNVLRQVIRQPRPPEQRTQSANPSEVASSCCRPQVPQLSGVQDITHKMSHLLMSRTLSTPRCLDQIPRNLRQAQIPLPERSQGNEDTTTATSAYSVSPRKYPTNQSMGMSSCDRYSKCRRLSTTSPTSLARFRMSGTGSAEACRSVSTPRSNTESRQIKLAGGRFVTQKTGRGTPAMSAVCGLHSLRTHQLRPSADAFSMTGMAHFIPLSSSSSTCASSTPSERRAWCPN